MMTALSMQSRDEDCYPRQCAVLYRVGKTTGFEHALVSGVQHAIRAQTDGKMRIGHVTMVQRLEITTCSDIVEKCCG
jgi:hypothetical protein